MFPLLYKEILILVIRKDVLKAYASIYLILKLFFRLGRRVIQMDWIMIKSCLTVIPEEQIAQEMGEVSIIATER